MNSILTLTWLPITILFILALLFAFGLFSKTFKAHFKALLQDESVLGNLASGGITSIIMGGFIGVIIDLFLLFKGSFITLLDVISIPLIIVFLLFIILRVVKM